MATARLRNKRGKVHYNDDWLNKVDGNGDKLSEYVQKESTYTFKSIYCQKSGLCFENQGLLQILQHSQGKKHKQIANIRGGRVPNVQVLGVISPEEEVVTDDEREGEGEVLSNNNENIPNNNRGGGPGIMRFLVQNQPPAVAPTTPQKLSLNDKIVKAEAVLCLTSVEKNWSFESMDTVGEILRMIDSDSRVLVHGIFPFVHSELLEDIRQSPVITLGVDAATNKRLGLTKSYDIKVRYFSQKGQEVRDVFLETHSLGHEDADVQVAKCLESIEEDYLDIKKVLAVSRDNPNVMKSFAKKFNEVATAEGNSNIFQAPDYLHPAHQALREAMLKLTVDIDEFFDDVFKFFKLSTARREDALEIRESLGGEENDSFFLRHLNTRWLTTGPVAKRIVEHWDSLRKYIVDFLANDRNQSSKTTVQSERWKRMNSVLRNSNHRKNLARIHLIIFLCELNQPFLKTMQSERPMVHRLFPDSVALVHSFLKLICQEDAIPYRASNFKTIDFNDSSTFLTLKHCNFGEAVRETLSHLSPDTQQELLLEFRIAVMAQCKYLIKTLPLENEFIATVRFLHPKFIPNARYVRSLQKVAIETNRFSTQEIDQIAANVTSLRSISVPDYSDENDSLDHFYIKCCDEIKNSTGEDPSALRKLMQIICCFPHSNAFLERGFSDTKRIIEGRFSLLAETLKAIKTVLDYLRIRGGMTNVKISIPMIESAKQAYSNMMEAKRKKQREEDLSRAKAKRQEEEREIKRKHEEENMSWTRKVNEKKAAVASLKAQIEIQDTNLEEALNMADAAKKACNRKAAIETGKLARKNLSELTKKLGNAELELGSILSKKPKLK